VGEIIGEAGGPQFEVYAAHGRGVFSSVLRARDLGARNPDTGAVPEVAIKVGVGGRLAGCWGRGGAQTQRMRLQAWPRLPSAC
jgi:hypothetical protein